MRPAIEPFQAVILNTRFTDPRVPIYSNVNGKILAKGLKVQKNLVKQLTQAVRWETSMHDLFRSGPNDDLPSVYECGPGQALSAMLGKINGKAAKKCQYIPV